MLYTTECGQNTIRQINATSKNVTTVAGTPNTAGNRDGAFSTALFSCPQAVAADVSRETPVLYVSERGTDSHYIRSVDFATGETYNVAGIGTASQRRDEVGALGAVQQPR